MLLGKYKNGNYNVKIYSDGTKIRYNDLDNLTPDFPECIDLNISNKCFHGCKFCYQGCTPNGKEANLDFLLKLANEFHPFTEVACNINHFDLNKIEPFLKQCRKRKVIVNVTVNQDEFMNHPEILKYMTSDFETGYFNSIGISLTDPSNEFINKIKGINNIVIHTIAGITTLEDYKKLYDNNFKVLILGYKTKGRGINFKSIHHEIDNKINELGDNLKEMVKHFKVLSFDNLALNQLRLVERDLIKNYDEFYMGDDGQYTFYIDAVNEKFYQSSLETNGFSCDNKTVDEMFDFIRNINV